MIVAGIAAVAANVLGTGSSGAVTSGAFKYAKARTGYAQVLPEAMFPADDVSAAEFGIGFGFLRSGPGVRRCFNSGVSLPRGAVIESAELFYSSTLAGDSITAALLGNDLASGAVSILGTAVIVEVPNGRAVRSLDLAAPVEVTAESSYTFNLCLGEDDIFHGLRITYRYESAGD